MFEFEACEVFKIKEFTFVNDCFKYERNEEIGHYGQTLIRICNNVTANFSLFHLFEIFCFKATLYISPTGISC